MVRAQNIVSNGHFEASSLTSTHFCRLVKNADSHSGPFSADVKVAEVNGKIRDVLKDFYGQESLPAQFSVILNIITDLIASQPDADNRYLFTYVYYYYDVDQKVFKPGTFIRYEILRIRLY